MNDIQFKNQHELSKLVDDVESGRFYHPLIDFTPNWGGDLPTTVIRDYITVMQLIENGVDKELVSLAIKDLGLNK